MWRFKRLPQIGFAGELKTRQMYFTAIKDQKSDSLSERYFSHNAKIRCHWPLMCNRSKFYWSFVVKVDSVRIEK